MAERVGFEPTVPLQGHAISSRARSASLASLRAKNTGDFRHRTGGHSPSQVTCDRGCLNAVAERVGFEPTLKLPPN